MSKQPPYTFRMPKELKKKAMEAAEKDRRTLPSWLKKVIEGAIEREEQTK